MKFDLSNKTNRFAQRMLLAFSSSLMELLETKEFEKITVGEICDACNYPRATFYNYFDDSYDLLHYEAESGAGVKSYNWQDAVRGRNHSVGKNRLGNRN